MKPKQLPWLLAGVTLIIHAAGNPHYGFFRDELYFIICGRHPAIGYVDQPPLTPLLAAGSQLFGQSLFLLRLIPAVCAAATVYIACLLADEMGGGSFAQVLSAICVALAPVLLAFGAKQGPDMLEMPLWPLAALYVLRITNGGDLRWWLAAGAAIGVAFESKYSVVFFAVALLSGLLVSPQRFVMRTKWFALAIVLASLIALPNALWQAFHGFPMLELLRNGQAGKNVILTPPEYLLSQIGILSPFLTPFAVAGIAWLLYKPSLRWLAYGYLVLIAAMMITHGKDYYPASIYPILFAAAGCALETWTATIGAWRPLIATAAVLLGLLTLPAVLPVLSTPQYVAYAKLLHIEPHTSEKNKMRDLPQDYADMHGWPEMVAAIAGVYNGLSPAERARTAIIAPNYGEAAALDFFGGQFGLPPALSGHNQYFLWGIHGFSGDIVIRPNGDVNLWRTRCKHVAVAAVFSNPLGMEYEDHMPILVCRGLKMPLAELWPKLKNYI